VDEPDVRLSDAERQDALDALSEHVRTGRLDLDEFGDLSARASAARRRSDLVPLFAELPDPRPAVLRTAPRSVDPPRGRELVPSRRLAAMAVPVAAVVGVILYVTVLRGMWPILLLPAIVMLIVGRRR
jgi:hypothetical protein